MFKKRFDIRFDEDAWKEYKSLDGSVKNIVDNYLERLESRADELGKELSNYQYTKLVGCKELKLRNLGIRIIFKVTNNFVNILRVVYILAVEHRSNDFVFTLANKRYTVVKKIPDDKLHQFLQEKKRFKKRPKR